MTSWAEALAEYQRVTMIMEAIDSDKNEEAYDAAANDQSEAIEDLIVTPAPDLGAIAVKLEVMQSSGNEHLLARILADIQRLSEPVLGEPSWGERHTLGYALPRTFPGISTALAEAAETYRVAHFSMSEGPEAGTGAAADAIAKIPATSFPDLAAKIMLGMLECEPLSHDGRMIIDLDDFSTDPAGEILLGAALDAVAMIPPTESPELNEAFGIYRDAMASLKGAPDDLSDAAAAPFHERMDAADTAFTSTPAITAAGVVMKLKRVFVAYVGEQWSDHAVFEQRPSDFDENVRQSDCHQEMLWRAIEDLERIAAEGGTHG